MERFSRAQVLDILRPHLSAGRLRYWERLRLVEPVMEGGRAWYSLQDLIALRTVIRLTLENVPAVRLRAALLVLAVDDEMSLKKPLLEMRLEALGREVVGEEDGLLLQPATGQRILDGLLRDTQEQPRARELRRWTVDEMLSAAMRADLDPKRWEQAAQAYRLVIERAPHRVEAHINLGTLEFKRRRYDEAEAAYRSALALDPGNAVVLFNLANVVDEQKRPAEALPYLLQAVDVAPRNGDVRYNLALLLEKLGRASEARPHWLAYLDIDPSSEWSALAKRHLEKYALAPKPTAQVIPLRPRREA